MFVLTVVVISSVFVLAAMAGLADALVHFVCWGTSHLAASKTPPKALRPPAQGITA